MSYIDKVKDAILQYVERLSPNFPPGCSGVGIHEIEVVLVHSAGEDSCSLNLFNKALVQLLKEGKIKAQEGRIYLKCHSI